MNFTIFPPSFKQTPMIRVPRLMMAALLAMTVPATWSQEKKALTMTDMMKFRQVESPSVSDDGRWVVHTARPDRGDPEVLVYATTDKTRRAILRGEKPVLSGDGHWVAAIHAIPAEKRVALKPGAENPPKPGMALLNITSGNIQIFDSVQSFSFSNDSRWLLYLGFSRDKAGKKGQREKEDRFRAGCQVP